MGEGFRYGKFIFNNLGGTLVSLKAGGKEGINDKGKSLLGKVLMPDGRGSRMKWRIILNRSR